MIIKPSFRANVDRAANGREKKVVLKVDLELNLEMVYLMVVLVVLIVMKMPLFLMVSFLLVTNAVVIMREQNKPRQAN